VIGVGGYSSFPVLRFAQSQGIPTFIHESNAFAGKSNIMLGRRATRVFTATTGMEKFFPADKILVTGNPVRAAIVQQVKERNEAIHSFGLDPQKKTILSMGGSLGAQHINEAIAAHIAEFAKHGLQLIWQTGKPFQQQASQLASGMANIYVCDFITDMDNAYAAADLVISRSGAMAIAELCVVKKPVVFVPYPFAAEDHQTMNAQQLVNAGAGEMIADKDALHKLVPAIIALATDERKQEDMKQHIGQLAVTNADSIIATEILNILDDRSK
jgi:UDP-N-acetylglucosamine--N-acetylmuramyl-(pentapeptide) pyrophosphoryl-undecaprenol N-acetylglucosamine transferase